VGGLDDDEEGVAVELDLRSLVRFDRVLDGQLVQVELAGDRLELPGAGLVDAEPDETVVLAGGPAASWRSRSSPQRSPFS
jgi:hypothetical protein